MSKFTIHGARGGWPVSGQSFLKYGGRTSCYSQSTNSGVIVFDAGTGINELGELLANEQTDAAITILFTHFHLDHVIGLPSFKPLYEQGRVTEILADRDRDDDWQASLKTIMGSPFWPMELLDPKTNIRLGDLPVGANGVASAETTLTIDDVEISWCRLNHPQQCLAYRARSAAGTIVLATDHEHGNAERDAALRDFCAGADILLCDSQYTPEEYPQRLKWGHSTWAYAARLACAAEVGELILTHHDPSRTDEALDAIVVEARKIFANTRGAEEQMSFA